MRCGHFRIAARKVDRYNCLVRVIYHVVTCQNPPILARRRAKNHPVWLADGPNTTRFGTLSVELPHA